MAWIIGTLIHICAAIPFSRCTVALETLSASAGKVPHGAVASSVCAAGQVSAEIDRRASICSRSISLKELLARAIEATKCVDAVRVGTARVFLTFIHVLARDSELRRSDLTNCALSAGPPQIETC